MIFPLTKKVGKLMNLKRRKVVVDTDFLNHMVAIRDFDAYRLICRCCEVLSVDPVIHFLVYDKEVVKDHPVTKQLVTTSVLEIIPFQSFLPLGAEAYYKIIVEELYAHIHGRVIELKDIFTEWKYLVSLGEIHSLSMCYFIKCDIFLSDDEGSQKLQRAAAQKLKILSDVRVYTRKDVSDRLAAHPEKPIRRSERKAIGYHRT